MGSVLQVSHHQNPPVVLRVSFSHSLAWSAVIMMRICKAVLGDGFFGPGEAVVLIALELCLRLSNSLAGVKLLCFCEHPFFVAGRTSV